MQRLLQVFFLSQVAQIKTPVAILGEVSCYLIVQAREPLKK